MVADYKYGFDGMTRDVMLEKMQKGWKSTETPCGSGSQLRNTINVRNVLPFVVKKYGIRTVNDAGAGDLRWIGKIAWDVDYRPFDLVPRRGEVTALDVTLEVMPEADLILCRHVLNHLSPKLALDALDNFRQSGRYLLMTNCDNQVKYWKHFGITLVEPIEKWPDTQKWRLELYDLTQGTYERCE